MSRETCDYLQELVSQLGGFLTSQLGPLPWGTPKLVLKDSLGADGRAAPGLIFLDTQWADTADPIYCELTIAHEVAHQWWGLALHGDALLQEPMAEFWALRSVGVRWGWSAELALLICARGRMAAALLGPGVGHSWWEARCLGRDVLAIHAWWRHEGDIAVSSMRRVAQSFISDRPPAALWANFGPHGLALARWAASSELLPVPFLDGTRIFDVAATGLATLVSVVDSTGQNVELWLDSEVEVAPGTRLAERQLGPVLAGNLAADVAYYQNFVGTP